MVSKGMEDIFELDELVFSHMGCKLYLSGGQEEIQPLKSTGSRPKYPVNSPGGLELYGIHHLILNSIMAADEDLHQESDVFFG